AALSPKRNQRQKTRHRPNTQPNYRSTTCSHMIPPYLVSHVFPRPVVTRLNDSIQAVFTATALPSLAFNFYKRNVKANYSATQADVLFVLRPFPFGCARIRANSSLARGNKIQQRSRAIAGELLARGSHCRAQLLPAAK